MRRAFFTVRVLISGLLMLAGGLLALSSLGIFADAFGQQGQRFGAQNLDRPGPRMIYAFHSDVSRPLREAPTIWLRPPSITEEGREELNPRPPNHHIDGPDPVIQDRFFSRNAPATVSSLPAPALTFDGMAIGVSGNSVPPDTNGAAGKNHYVQAVNQGLQVFDKTTGSSALGPVTLASLWSGFGGTCESDHGDPVVLYDRLADRFVISRLAAPNGSSVPQDACIAVSTGGDPTGSWYRYGYHVSNNFFDYPKLGVWPDGYYLSANMFDATSIQYLGPQPFVFDRAKMLVGDPSATVQTPGIVGGPNETPFLPADLDGINAPPAGGPNPFVSFPEFYSTAGTTVYKLWHFQADFANPANSKFTLFANPFASSFTQLCPDTTTCVPQPAGSALAGLGGLLMFRNAYRNFADGHDALVSNYAVNANGVAGARWLELRDVISTKNANAYQESTYRPDTTWRWAGSVAMDNQGNLALGFSASSSTIFPEIRYAGRLAGDPINMLTQGEAMLFAGQGTQDVSPRWGDYSAMTVDPVDDCTFWYTNEYYPAGNTAKNWRTRIGAFKFTQCTAPAKGTAHFTVSMCTNGPALPNSLIFIDGNLYGSTLANGIYDATLAPGNHTCSVSLPTYPTVTGNFSITNGQTTNINLCLQRTAVIGSAGSTLLAEGCALSNSAIDPNEAVRVSFKLTNTGTAATSNLVATLQSSGGVTNPSSAQSYGAIGVGQTAERSFAFTATGTCGGTITATLQLQDGATNFGTVSYTYSLGTQTIALNENFDGVMPPALPVGWTATNAAGSAPLWTTSSSGIPSPAADSIPNAASIALPPSVSDKLLDSPNISIGALLPQLTFRNNYNLDSGFDGAVLEISINGGAFTDIVTAGGSFATGGYNGTISNSFSNPIGGRMAWTGSSGGFITTTVNLPGAAMNQNVKFRWRMGSDSVGGPVGGWRIDNVTVITSVCATCSDLPFRIDSIARNGQDIVVSFDANVNKTYRLERNLGLSTPNWQGIPGVADLTAATSGPTLFTDPNATSLGEAFYRVRLLP